MADKHQPHGTGSDMRYSEFAEEYDEISIRDLILTLWRSRAKIVIYSLAAALIIFAVAGTTFLLQEKQKVTKIQFRLEFEGADKGEYPNGMKFSTADILAGPVLDKVYRENDLKRFIEFPDFKAALAVYQTNDQLSFLEHEYAQKLSERNLSVEARQRLEAEFLEKKKNLMVPSYSLTFRDPERVDSLSVDLTAKILKDILSSWAEYASRVKGADQYQMQLVSRNILSKNMIQSVDYLVGTDMLRLAIKRIQDNLKELLDLPGAKTVQVGKDGTSLTDLSYRVTDLDQFEVSPIFGLIQKYGISRSPEMTIAYLENRLFEANRKKEQTSSDLDVYASSLDQYMRRSPAIGSIAGGNGKLPAGGMQSGVPTTVQFDGSFLDSIMQMAQQKVDAQFRQDITEKMIEAGLLEGELENSLKYYQKLYRTVQQSDKTSNMNTDNETIKSAIAQIQETQMRVYGQLMQTIDEMNAIYEELSEQNLNPNAVLYSVTSPVVPSVERSLSLKRLLLFVILALCVAEGIIFLSVLLLVNGRRSK